jgi:vesicle-associated membrane protein 7
MTLEKVLERGEKIELLVEKTDQLNQTAVQFKKKSTGLKQAMWWKNFKLTLLLVLIALVCKSTNQFSLPLSSLLSS